MEARNLPQGKGGRGRRPSSPLPRPPQTRRVRQVPRTRPHQPIVIRSNADAAIARDFVVNFVVGDFVV